MWLRINFICMHEYFLGCRYKNQNLTLYDEFKQKNKINSIPITIRITITWLLNDITYNLIVVQEIKKKGRELWH